MVLMMKAPERARAETGFDQHDGLLFVAGALPVHENQQVHKDYGQYEDEARDRRPKIFL